MTSFVNLTMQYIAVSGLVGNEQYIIILEYAAVMGAFLSFIGMIANIIIIRTFIAMGVKDGVTVSFLALAIFDVTYLISGVALGIIVMFYSAELKSVKRFPIEPYGMSIYFTNVMILINITNVLATTFIALARTMCVARPLQFKNSFTRDRAVAVMVSFVVFAISLYIPMFVNMGMSSRFDKMTNTSRPSWWRSAARESVKEIVWVIADGVLPVASELIITICVVIMSSNLRASSRFRQSSGAVSGKICDENLNNINSKHQQQNKVPESKVSLNKLTGKDVKVVQQVVLISVVYVVCNIPKLLIILATTIEPEFAIGRRYMKLYMSSNAFRKHVEMINAATNLIIYYKYNTKFRSILTNKVKRDITF